MQFIGWILSNEVPSTLLSRRYTKSPLDDGEYPYDAVGAALRHGPAPFLTRVFNADEYEQGVMKYMLSAKVDRATAVGNTDAKLNNAADWAYQKMEEKRGKPVVDYTSELLSCICAILCHRVEHILCT